MLQQASKTHLAGHSGSKFKKIEPAVFLDVLELKSLGFRDPLYCFRCECY